MTDLCAAAKALAARNFRVFPLQPNSKIPPAGSWLAAASDVADRVDSVFQNHPQANVGIATGRRIMVLDFDTKNGQLGLQSRFVLEAMGLPDTLEATTPSGGVHLYFNVPEHVVISNSAGRIAPGVDVRGHHGYVVAPPSSIDGHNYQWVDPEQKIADAPEWLIEMCLDVQRERHVDAGEPLGPIDTPEALQRGAEWLRDSAPTAVEGDHGDLTTFKVAACLKDFGIGLEMAHCLMAEHWDGVKSFPAWGDELMSKVEAAFKSGRNRPGSANAAAQFGVVELSNGSVDGGDAGAPKRRMYSLSADEAAESAYALSNNPLIDGVLEKGEISMLYGKWGQGKSFVALDMAYHVALGRPWNGRETVHGLVIYLAAEGGKGARKRLLALKQSMGAGATLELIPCSANLYGSQKDMAELLEIVKESEDKHGVPVSMIVVDTLHKVFVGGDENSSSDFGAMLHKVVGLVERTGAHIMLVHHAGKDAAKGARGSSSLPADIEAVMKVDRRVFEMEKNKDDELPKPVPFGLKRMDLGRDAKGRPLVSCVIEWGTAGEFKQAVPLDPGTAAERMWLAFKDAAEAKADADGVDWREVSITTSEWSDAYVLRLKVENGTGKGTGGEGASKQRLAGLRKEVTVHGHVRKIETNQWVADAVPG